MHVLGIGIRRCLSTMLQYEHGYLNGGNSEIAAESDGVSSEIVPESDGVNSGVATETGKENGFKRSTCSAVAMGLFYSLFLILRRE
ncbi:hypothetical protein FGIG_10796 [Fasciola gigantica]|uniref:Uncharacterized protein n=1 Tax=Fasciola gigantica TaxID=46835 RepID=A0A504YDR2_FASGI|nr:hypothetical protein FGIG_10796 [Fasciola gigantica]